jgi:hypothetical protein
LIDAHVSAREAKLRSAHATGKLTKSAATPCWRVCVGGRAPKSTASPLLAES